MHSNLTQILTFEFLVNKRNPSKENWLEDAKVYFILTVTLNKNKHAMLYFNSVIVFDYIWSDTANRVKIGRSWRKSELTIFTS